MLLSCDCLMTVFADCPNRLHVYSVTQYKSCTAVALCGYKVCRSVSVNLIIGNIYGIMVL